jgi:DNA repair protein RecN (Recombination protein N)
MLSKLHIENIAVIERADISFAPGFNVLTGETGAGKSIVIDAIGAVTGERTSRDLIRTGARSAVVSALFQNLPNLPWMEEAGVEPDGEGKLLLRREIGADGKNACTAGGRGLSVSQLRVLGSQLLNIHGQHDGQLLMDEAYHLNYLDRFGRNEDSLFAYRECYDRVSELERRIRALQMDEAEKVRRMDTLRYQIAELERARLQEGEDEALDERRNLLRNARSWGTAWSGVSCSSRAMKGAMGRPCCSPKRRLCCCGQRRSVIYSLRCQTNLRSFARWRTMCPKSCGRCAASLIFRPRNSTRWREGSISSTV